MTTAVLTIDGLAASLRDIVGDAHVLPPSAEYLADETETRGLRGRADLVVRPGTADEVAQVVAAAYAARTPIIPRGGGTGFAGGAVPFDGGVVLGLDRLDRIRAFDPLLWRMHVEAGVRTSEVRRHARESGRLFPPDPGAAESSRIGGNIATNAGGPHAFKYGVTGAWVLGIEAVVSPGELITVGGPDPQGRRRLRPQEPADRLRGHARDRHRRLAPPPAGPRGESPGRRVVLRRGDGRRRDRSGARQRPAGGGARVSRRARDGGLGRDLPNPGAGGHGVRGDRRGGRLARQWSPRAVGLHEAVKQVFDPDNLLNPGKKAAR